MNGAVQAVVDELTAQLEGVRERMSSQGEEAVRAACADTLDQALGRLDGKQRDAVLEGLRGQLIERARSGGGSSSGDDGRVAELEAERDRLKAEVQRLRKAASSGGGGSSDAMARFREGMEQIAKTGKVDAASLGLSEDDTVMLQLCQELLRFALDYEMGVNMLRAEMSVGNTSAMDTQMLRGLQQQVRKRFREALDQKEGAMAELRQSLNAGAKFIVELNTAYNHALSTGSKEMLGAIDPQEILEKHKRMLGHDFEKAFQEILRVHGDLAQLGRNEMWERFFYERFREKIEG